MFVVGLEFRMDIVQKKFGSAVAVSLAGMTTPFALGAGLGWYFFHHTNLFPAKTSQAEALIFMGAFPSGARRRARSFKTNAAGAAFPAPAAGSCGGQQGSSQPLRYSLVRRVFRAGLLVIFMEATS